MLSILVVDDEKFIRKGLSATVKEAGTQFEICGEAANGLEALSLIRNHRPDVVVTDIKMPKMNGIELVERLSLEYPEIRKIILSGFDEFDYVRESMKNGAVDYILKPVDEERVKKLLYSLDEEINKEKIKNHQEIEEYKRLFLESVIEGKSLTPKDSEKWKFAHSELFKNGRYCVLVASLDNYNFCLKNAPEETGGQAKQIKNDLHKLIKEDKSITEIIYRDDIVFVCNLADDECSAVNLAERICSNILRAHNIPLSLAIGESVDEIYEINTSYKSAIKMLEGRFYKNNSNIYSCSDIDDNFKTIKRLDKYENITEKIKDYFYAGEKDRFKSQLNLLCQELCNNKVYPNEACKIMTKLYIKIEGESNKFGRVSSTIYSQRFSYIDSLKLFDCFKDIITFSENYYFKIMDGMTKSTTNSSNEVIETAKKYILKNYNEDLSLEKVAEVVYLNPNYLSEIFKYKTGESFVEYITRIRVQQAKKLLRDLEYKTYQVGQMVGYDDPSYFSKVFKKTVGISPSRYRDMIVK